MRRRGRFSVRVTWAWTGSFQRSQAMADRAAVLVGRMKADCVGLVTYPYQPEIPPFGSADFRFAKMVDAEQAAARFGAEVRFKVAVVDRHRERRPCLPRLRALAAEGSPPT